MSIPKIEELTTQFDVNDVEVDMGELAIGCRQCGNEFQFSVGLNSISEHGMTYPKCPFCEYEYKILREG